MLEAVLLSQVRIYAGPGSSVGRALELRVMRAHVPATKVRGFEARRALDIYEPPDGYGCGWWQAAARRSRVGDRPCAAMCVR